MKKLKISNIISPGDCCSASIRLPVCLVQDWSTMYNVENKLYNVNKFMRGLRSFQVCYKAEWKIITVRIAGCNPQPQIITNIVAFIMTK